jgi:hypothetical protein
MRSWPTWVGRPGRRLMSSLHPDTGAVLDTRWPRSHARFIRRGPGVALLTPGPHGPGHWKVHRARIEKLQGFPCVRSAVVIRRRTLKPFRSLTTSRTGDISVGSADSDLSYPTAANFDLDAERTAG